MKMLQTEGISVKRCGDSLDPHLWFTHSLDYSSRVIVWEVPFRRYLGQRMHPVAIEASATQSLLPASKAHVPRIQTVPLSLLPRQVSVLGVGFLFAWQVYPECPWLVDVGTHQVPCLTEQGILSCCVPYMCGLQPDMADTSWVRSATHKLFALRSAH